MKVLWLTCAGLALQLGIATTATALDAAARASEAPAALKAELNDAQKLAPAILGSIRTNSERLEGVELSLTRTLQNAGVTQETTIEESLPDGGKVITRKKPQMTFAERVVILEDRLRIDQGGSGTSPAITYWYDGERWTEANTSARRIARMHTHQMGGRMLDPRESAGIDPRSSLANILSEPALKDATLSTDESVSTIATATNPGGQKLVVDFDSRQSMLPTRSRLYHLNGALARDAKLTYGRVQERDAWVLQGITERVYDETVDGTATPEKWKQQLVTSASCSVLNRETAEQLLSPTVPDGYRVIDYTDESTMQRKAPAAVRPLAAEFPLKWFILAHVLLFAVVAGLYYWRRRTSPV